MFENYTTDNAVIKYCVQSCDEPKLLKSKFTTESDTLCLHASDASDAVYTAMKDGSNPHFLYTCSVTENEYFPANPTEDQTFGSDDKKLREVDSNYQCKTNCYPSGTTNASLGGLLYSYCTPCGNSPSNLFKYDPRSAVN